MIRVVLVDDHPVVRAGLRAVLEASGQVAVVADVPDGASALTATRTYAPDVVVTDLRLGAGMDGVELTTALLAEDPTRRVLLLTTYDTDADILRAIEAGAAGYLLKDVEPARLVESVEAAAHGETVLAPVVAQRLVWRLTQPTTALTARELDVLRLAATGASNRQIARELFVSEATVKTHLAHAFDKLGADNRTAAVAVARNRGLLA